MPFRSTDEALKKDVVDELFWDNRIDAADITVEVEDGKVLLGGSAPTYYSAAAATDDALGVSGVADVQNRIAVRYPGTGPILNDEEMQSRIQSDLSSDPDIDSLDVRVAVRDGVVVLEGTVTALWKKNHAETLASRLPGVVGMQNHLAVVPTKAVSDKEVAADIVASLRRKRGVNEDDVDVRVENGVVNVIGIVPGPLTRRRIKETVYNTPGAVQLVDNMTVSAGGSRV